MLRYNRNLPAFCSVFEIKTYLSHKEYFRVKLKQGIFDKYRKNPGEYPDLPANPNVFHTVIVWLVLFRKPAYRIFVFR
jgi:hypothetical protein